MADGVTPRDTPGGMHPTPPARCTATRRDGQRCTQWPVTGATVCRMHGGTAPQVKRKAARRLAERAARTALDEVGVRAIEDPIAELHSLTEDAVAIFTTLKERMAHRGEDGWTVHDDNGKEQMRAEFEAMERAHDRAVKFLEVWVKLGMDERLVRVREAEAELMRNGLEVVFTALALTHQQREEALAAFLGWITEQRRLEAA